VAKESKGLSYQGFFSIAKDLQLPSRLFAFAVGLAICAKQLDGPPQFLNRWLFAAQDFGASGEQFL
jgi:hypothetical protein